MDFVFFFCNKDVNTDALLARAVCSSKIKKKKVKLHELDTYIFREFLSNEVKRPSKNYMTFISQGERNIIETVTLFANMA